VLFSLRHAPCALLLLKLFQPAIGFIRTFAVINKKPLTMNTSKSKTNFTLMHGVILGLILIAFSLLLYLLDMSRSGLQYVSYAILIGYLAYAMVQWRDKYNDRLLGYGQAFSTGFMVILFSSFILAAYVFVFFGYVAPDEINVMLREAEDNVLKSQPDISDDTLEITMKWTKRMMTPSLMAVWAFVGNLLSGLVVSAILAAFVKKETQPF
jgi:predicted PurR-regulated permease PerM